MEDDFFLPWNRSVDIKIREKYVSLFLPGILPYYYIETDLFCFLLLFCELTNKFDHSPWLDEFSFSDAYAHNFYLFFFFFQIFTGIVIHIQNKQVLPPSPPLKKTKQKMVLEESGGNLAGIKLLLNVYNILFKIIHKRCFFFFLFKISFHQTNKDNKSIQCYCVSLPMLLLSKSFEIWIEILSFHFHIFFFFFNLKRISFLYLVELFYFFFFVG